MSMAEMITETQAVALAGVSAKTLRRFQDSGYLEVSSSSEGEALYVKSQILEIFGAADALSQRARGSEAQACTTEESSAAPAPIETAATPSELTASGPVTATESGDHSASRELERLRNLVTLQERILDLKDAELADLRSQRDWLRSRVERLEEKSERDQILLLSETQTIRKLVSLQESRKSPIQNILEWLGISKQPELRQLSGPNGYSNADAVEVKATAANA